jgi:DNA-directed RNA polymerase specialized sigma24 family protein
MLDSGLVIQVTQPLRPDGSRILDDPPSPKQKWVLTAEAFDRLLLWLDPDRDRAGEKYEVIRTNLMRRFTQLHADDPEHLTNETIDRTAKKLPQIIQNYQNDPANYFYAIAYYIYRESRHRAMFVALDTDLTRSEDSGSNPAFGGDDLDDDLLSQCLDECLGHLTPEVREMILEYYQGERDVKIKTRKLMAAQMGIKLSNLRLKVQRVRSRLKTCILECMEGKTRKLAT